MPTQHGGIEMALLYFLKTKSAILPTSEETALRDGVTRSANAAVRREIEVARIG